MMIARLTDKNLLTIPEAVVSDLPDTEFFEITCDDGRIVLTPVSETMIIKRTNETIELLRGKGITEKDIADAVRWARENADEIEVPETLMTLHEVLARLEQDEDGRWSAWIASLPGCAAWGHTRDEALAALKDAAEAYLEDMLETGELTNREGKLVIEKHR